MIWIIASIIVLYYIGKWSKEDQQKDLDRGYIDIGNGIKLKLDSELPPKKWTKFRKCKKNRLTKKGI